MIKANVSTKLGHEGLGLNTIQDIKEKNKNIFVQYKKNAKQFVTAYCFNPLWHNAERKSRKWKTDESKVMNWQYYDKEDYYIDPQGVRFNFHVYRKQTDKNEFVREFKEYQAEKFEENQQALRQL